MQSEHRTGNMGRVSHVGGNKWVLRMGSDEGPFLFSPDHALLGAADSHPQARAVPSATLAWDVAVAAVDDHGWRQRAGCGGGRYRRRVLQRRRAQHRARHRVRHGARYGRGARCVGGGARSERACGGGVARADTPTAPAPAAPTRTARPRTDRTELASQQVAKPPARVAPEAEEEFHGEEERAALRVIVPVAQRVRRAQRRAQPAQRHRDDERRVGELPKVAVFLDW